ncbi:MAG: hypothetical protein ACE5IG_02115 [Dehalococcoidia bacterium]
MKPLAALLSLGLLLAACASPPDAAALLLTPEDFPGRDLAVEHRRANPSSAGASSAETELTGPGFTLFHSVVLFGSAQEAQEAISRVQENQESLGLTAVEAPAVGEESVVLAGQQGGRDSVSILFRRGAAFVRLTLVGSDSVTEMIGYAGRAHAKLR